MYLFCRAVNEDSSASETASFQPLLFSLSHSSAPCPLAAFQEHTRPHLWAAAWDHSRYRQSSEVLSAVLASPPLLSSLCHVLPSRACPAHSGFIRPFVALLRPVSSRALVTASSASVPPAICSCSSSLPASALRASSLGVLTPKCVPSANSSPGASTLDIQGPIEYLCLVVPQTLQIHTPQTDLLVNPPEIISSLLFI